MSSFDEPKAVVKLILGLDGNYDDEQNVFVSAAEGGEGTTSASCWVTLTDADTSERQRYLVEVHLDEEDSE